MNVEPIPYGLPSKGLHSNHLDANPIALAFRKRRSFMARLPGKETGGRAQICLLDLVFSHVFMS